MGENAPRQLLNADPPEYRLATLNRSIRTLMEDVLRPFELRLVEWRLLQCLDQRQVRTINDLSELAVIERTVTGRLVDRLATRGLLARTPLPSDRRVSQVQLTSTGQELLDKCAHAVEGARNQLFDGMSALDINRLLALLSRMQWNATKNCRPRV